MVGDRLAMPYRVGIRLWIIALMGVVLFCTGRVDARGSAPVRETVNFDFAWRHKSYPVLGAAFHSACRSSGSPWSFNVSQDMACDPSGLLDVGAFDDDIDCAVLCCMTVYCRAWSYDTTTGRCGIDSRRESFSCGIKANGTVSGVRDVPSPTPDNFPSDVSELMSLTYDDSQWEIVNAPHDSLMNGEFSINSSAHQGNLPYRIVFYRKHFNLPAEWKDGGVVSVYFEGIFRSSFIYLNGVQVAFHESGYTSFSVRLDNVTGVMFGPGKEKENVLGIRAQGFGGSGWWYEGAGLYRHNYLVFHNDVHIAMNGVLGNFFVDDDSIQHHSDGRSVTAMAEFTVRTEVQMDTSVADAKGGKVTSEHVLYDAANSAVARMTSNATWVSPGGRAMLLAMASLPNVTLWSTSNTYMYRMETSLTFQSQAVDTINDTFVGALSSKWDSNTGFSLNSQPLKWRGFCNHNSLAGVGAAIPDRMNLFRAQSMKSIGGNSWRTSHNPPVPGLLDILDRLGVLVWDETRNFGQYDLWAANMGEMVKRDRNHPSIMLWSFCNEAGCLQQDPDVGSIGGMFRGAAKLQDPYKPVSGNMMTYSEKLLFSKLTGELDVQGFSHMPGFIFDDFHELYPAMPILNSECCSCVTQRGEDEVTPTHNSNFNADCVSEQTSRGISRPFVSGVMVWTLFDYFGEPSPIEWPHVSSSFGTFDLAGFGKAAAFWYRSWWLYNFTHSAESRQFDVPSQAPSLIDSEQVQPYLHPAGHDVISNQSKDTGNYLVHIVQQWEPSDNDVRTIQVYTNAPEVSLAVNGKEIGRQTVQWYGWAEFKQVQFEAGNLTATAFAWSGSPLAVHTCQTSGKASSIRLVVDVPSAASGTGSALLLDGQDTGMVRAMVVDSRGVLVPSANHTITFKVSSGPGRVIGVGNGDPACHESNKATSRSAYHGLARAIVQVSMNSAMPAHVRRRLIEIDSEGGRYTGVLSADEDTTSSTVPANIVLEASSPGLQTDTVSIPVSSDFETDGVLATAENWMKNQATELTS